MNGYGALEDIDRGKQGLWVNPVPGSLHLLQVS